MTHYWISRAHENKQTVPRVNPRAQGHDSTFTICHALVKKAILEGKRATVPSDFLLAVYNVSIPQILNFCVFSSIFDPKIFEISNFEQK